MAAPADDRGTSGDSRKRSLGGPGEIVRVLNFAGGGFDTVMQLGVTHALLVTQGRAPDVVVGMSAGAIQAAALADILRSDTGREDRLSNEALRYEATLNERVARFREFVDACHRAPEDLVDKLLPDTYQIDSFEPLIPLEQPSMHPDEREERRQWTASKAGLVRLYNDLLGLHIPAGVLTRLIRRFLGCQAVGALGRPTLAGKCARINAYAAEIMKLWLLLGEHVLRFAPLVPLAGRPLLSNLFGRQFHASHQSAETIMFRFALIDRIQRWVIGGLSFLLLLNVWVGLSALILYPVGAVALRLLTEERPVAAVMASPGIGLWALAMLVLSLAPVLASLAPFQLRSLMHSIRSWALGAFVFITDLVKWTLVLVGLSAIPGTVIAIIARNPSGGDEISYLANAGILLAILLFVLVVFSVSYFLILVVRGRNPRAFLQACLHVVVLIGVLSLIPAGMYVAATQVDLIPLVAEWMGVTFLLDFALDVTGHSGETLADLSADARDGTLDFPGRALLALTYATAVIGFSQPAAFVVAILLGIWLLGSYAFRKDRTSAGMAWFMRRFLDWYHLGPSLTHGYALKKFLVDLFDPTFYGNISLTAAAQRALGDEDLRSAREASPPARTRIADYATADARRPGIHLAIPVADARSGRLKVLAPRTSIIDALVAATALPPLFSPKEIDGHPYVDASSIGNIPTRPLMQFLRESDVHDDIEAIHIYAVDALPVSKSRLSPPIEADGKEKTTPYLNLVDTATRAMQLQRFRDAKIERKLTSIFTATLSANRSTATISRHGSEKKFYRSYVAPIELDRPLNLNKQILLAQKQTRRDEIAETIAMGCRAALQAMLADTLASQDVMDRASGSGEDRFIDCSAAVKLYRKRNPADPDIELPGRSDGAPGVAEICKHCWIRDDLGEVVRDPASPKSAAHQSLRVRPFHTISAARSDEDDGELPPQIADWPRERATSPVSATTTRRSVAESNEPVAGGNANNQQSAAPPRRDPAIVAVFGGGVFRGVFQMGVMTALSLTRLKPTMVAGASVGAITAAMAAPLLHECERTKRNRRLAHLASVYLAMDRLVLTDRFSDFIRNWTIRASEARISVRDADIVFRKYDFGSSRAFEDDLRAVVAGLERLFYVSPYELNRIVSAARHRDIDTFIAELKDRVQTWLDRMNVGTEVLGAEPLRQLIEAFVITEDLRSRPHTATIQDLAGGTQLLATTTNLTQGTLRILGSYRDSRSCPTPISLIEALLASSAFPGVFRPRRSWDLFPGDTTSDEYVDGGIVDNLPIDPSLSEIRDQVDKMRTLSARPESGTPHLMVAASLEPERSGHSPSDDSSLSYWPELTARTRRFKQNLKLDMYQSSLDDVTALFESLEREEQKSARIPLHVKLVSIKPKWLCSTFAFHPMLGFRRLTQARSIAHGCASTLVAFADLRDDAHAWELDAEAIPVATSLDDAPARLHTRERLRAGKCWLVDGLSCPYSRQSIGEALSPESRRWVSEIHRQCWDRSTHTSEGHD